MTAETATLANRVFHPGFTSETLIPDVLNKYIY